MRKHWSAVFGGVGLSTAFFLPIAAAGNVGAPMLMWEARHTVELVVAWLAVSAAAAAVLVWAARVKRPRFEAGILAALLLPSLLSLIVVSGRNSSLTRETVDSVRTVATAGALTAFVGMVALWIFRPRWLVALIRTTLPVGIVFVFSGVQALVALPIPARPAGELARPAPRHGSGQAVGQDREGGEAPRLGSGQAVGQDREPSSCRSVYVLLFDELSNDAVFEGDEVRLTSVSSRLSSARVYRHALAPSNGTEASVSDYLSVSHSRGSTPAPGSATLFGAARAAGLSTEAIGWYFPYCEALGSTADRCRNYSMYNAATLYDGFNPLAPIATVLNIWPFQMPIGLVKRPVSVWLHRAQLDAMIARASAPASAEPVLRWVHFNVPHVPWIRDAGFLSLDAFRHTRDLYLAQMPEVDRAVGAVFAALEASGRADRTTVVLTADHGSREGHAGDPYHVPLVVWDPGGRHEEANEDVKVGEVLRGIVRGACRPAAIRD